jgi:hypothetical protein
VQKPLKAFPSCCWLKRNNFNPFSLKDRVSANNYEKSKEHLKTLKNTSVPFLVQSIQQHNFQPVSISCDSPFKESNRELVGEEEKKQRLKSRAPNHLIEEWSSCPA